MGAAWAVKDAPPAHTAHSYHRRYGGEEINVRRCREINSPLQSNRAEEGQFPKVGLVQGYDQNRTEG